MLTRANSVVVVGVVASSTWAGGLSMPPPEQSGQSAPVATSTDSTNVQPGDAISLLQKRIERIDWEEFPFNELLTWLREQGENRVNVVARKAALKNEDVDDERRVTLNLTNVTVAEVLNEALDQLSREGKLQYRATENFITISTEEDFNRRLVLRVYNVADLLFRLPDFGAEAPQIDLTGQGGQGGGHQGGGRSVFSGAGGQGQQQGHGEERQETQTRLHSLRDVIVATIAPESWMRVGHGEKPSDRSGRGRIEVYENFLLVLNTLEVHEQLAGWFHTNR